MVTAAAAALKQEASNLAALKQLPTGNPAAPPQAVQDEIAAVQQVLEPILNGGSQSTVSNALQLAQQALEAAQNQGLPGALADVISTLKGVASFAGPIVEGIPGGPAGIVAGVLLAGLELYQNQTKFNALKSALLNAPLIRRRRLCRSTAIPQWRRCKLRRYLRPCLRSQPTR